MSALVFTYGTLKKGFINEPLLGDQKFLGRAVLLEPLFRVVEVNDQRYPFPALVESADGYAVYGELYEVTGGCLKYLDRLEGVPHYYDRTLVKVLLGDGRIEEKVIAYKFMGEHGKYAHIGPVWPMKELSRYRLEGRKFVEQEVDIEFDGVALYNKRNEVFATGAYQTAEELRAACLPRRMKYAARQGQDEAWSPQYFEARPLKGTRTVKQCQLKCEGLEDDSPVFESRNELADWAAEHATFFGGMQGSAGEWRKVFTEAAPIIDGQLTT